MKNLILILLVTFFFSNQIQAQRTQVIYAELGGAGLAYSVNYDTRFLEGEDKLGARIGIGATKDFVVIPLQLNYLFGEGNNKLELGVGITTALNTYKGSDKKAEVFMNASLMYRFQKEDGNFMFRAGLSPTFVPVDDNDLFGELGLCCMNS